MLNSQTELQKSAKFLKLFQKKFRHLGSVLHVFSTFLDVQGPFFTYFRRFSVTRDSFSYILEGFSMALASEIGFRRSMALASEIGFRRSRALASELGFRRPRTSAWEIGCWRSRALASESSQSQLQVPSSRLEAPSYNFQAPGYKSQVPVEFQGPWALVSKRPKWSSKDGALAPSLRLVYIY